MIGAERLKKYNVSMVRVFKELRSENYEYAVVEKLDIKFTLAEYLKLGPGTYDKNFLDTQLVKFAKSTEPFAYIQDLTTNQIVWTGEEWKLIDWENWVYTPSLFLGGYAFNKMWGESKIPADLRKRIREALIEERNRRLAENLPTESLISRCMRLLE